MCPKKAWITGNVFSCYNGHMESLEAQTRSRLVGLSGVWSLSGIQGCLILDRFQSLPQYSQALSCPLVMCVWA